MPTHLKENPAMEDPTHEQCSTNAPITLDDGRTGYAIWYPTMGGYVSHAIIVADGNCFEAWVWHDGDFPFSGEDGIREDVSPRKLHHCDPEQFINFGRTVERLLGEDAPSA